MYLFVCFEVIIFLVCIIYITEHIETKRETNCPSLMYSSTTYCCCCCWCESSSVLIGHDVYSDVVHTHTKRSPNPDRWEFKWTVQYQPIGSSFETLWQTDTSDTLHVKSISQLTPHYYQQQEINDISCYECYLLNFILFLFLFFALLKPCLDIRSSSIKSNIDQLKWKLFF